MNRYQEIYRRAESLSDYTIAIRRDFHQHPELGLQEFRTSEIVANTLDELGYQVKRGVGKTGVVGTLDSGKPGLVVLIRFDMDALPIQEENNTAYSSQVPNVMHACGHDGHTAIGLTVAKMLAEIKGELSGKVKLMFQPGEEGMNGARLMIEDGVLRDPTPDYALACHVWNDKPLGWFSADPGPLMSGAEFFTVKLTGKGGHGAAPHQTIDPVIAVAQTVLGLQTIVSRNIPPEETAVVSVTQLIAGEAANIIPQTAEFRGTIRTYDESIREQVISRFRTIIEHTAEAYRCKPEITINRLTLPVVNEAGVSDRVKRVIKAVVPQAELVPHRTMGSEDMSFVMKEIPGCFIFIGSANAEKGLNYGHHHPRFDFDEQALTYGAAILTASTLSLLKSE
ncbi:MAG TPA: amidohydrolase [Anaerolineaceae bacterium]